MEDIIFSYLNVYIEWHHIHEKVTKLLRTKYKNEDEFIEIRPALYVLYRC